MRARRARMRAFWRRAAERFFARFLAAARAPFWREASRAEPWTTPNSVT